MLLYTPACVNYEMSALYYMQFDSTIAKLSDITTAIIIYIDSVCGCTFPPSHVYANEFTCPYNEAQEVIYRAKLKGLQARDCGNLIQHLRQWTEDKSRILIQGNRLRLDSMCDLEIDSLDTEAACVIGVSPQTPSPSPSGEGGIELEIIIGAAAGGGVMILLILILFIVICCFCCKHGDKNR